MRYLVAKLSVLGLVLIAAVAGFTKPALTEDHGSVVIVFKDGHRQSFAMTELSRIEFKTPAVAVFKDGHHEKIAAADIARIEFENSSGNPMTHGRAHFIGKWEVGDGGGHNFFITLEENGDARKSIGASHGTWTVVDGEARISWDDGWHDAIRPVGTKHEKVAYEPGRPWGASVSRCNSARHRLRSPACGSWRRKHQENYFVPWFAPFSPAIPAAWHASSWAKSWSAATPAAISSRGSSRSRPIWA